MPHNPARTLIDRIRGQSWLEAIPLKWRSSVAYIITKIPGVANSVLEDDLTGGVVASQVTTNRFNEREKQTTTLDTSVLEGTLLGRELTEKFGGDLLDVEETASFSPVTAAEGEDVVEAETINVTKDPNFQIAIVKRRNAVAWPVVASRLFDKEMLVEYPKTEQVVPAGTSEGSQVAGQQTEIQGIDKWRSLRVITSKAPAATSEGTAIISYDYHPFAFPGLIDTYMLTASQGQLGFKRARAELCKHTIRTWWVNSSTTPVIAVSDIIQDDISIVRIVSVTQLSFSSAVLANMTGLHDDYLAVSIGGSVFYPATTPSFSEYTGRSYTTVTGSTTFNSGSTSVTGVNTRFLTWFGPGGYISDSAHTPVQIASVASNTQLFLVSPWPYATATIPVSFINVSQGASWIGTEKVIAASITPTEIYRQWKIQTRSVIMR